MFVKKIKNDGISTNQKLPRQTKIGYIGRLYVYSVKVFCQSKGQVIKNELEYID